MEQPFLISYSGDHGKSKGEGLTQGKPTTCLKEPGTSFNTLLSKKWCTPVLSIWEAGDRKISKAVIRHSCRTRRALWPQTASDSSHSQQVPSQHRVTTSTLFSIPPPQARIAAGHRLQAILPHCPPLLPCYGTAALMLPISTLIQQLRRIPTPEVPTTALFPNSCSKYGNTEGTDAPSTKIVKVKSSSLAQMAAASSGEGNLVQRVPCLKGRARENLVKARRGWLFNTEFRSATITGDPKEEERFIFKLRLHRNCTGNNMVKKRPLCHTSGLFHLSSVPKTE